MARRRTALVTCTIGIGWGVRERRTTMGWGIICLVARQIPVSQDHAEEATPRMKRHCGSTADGPNPNICLNVDGSHKTEQYRNTMRRTSSDGRIGGGALYVRLFGTPNEN